MLDPEALRELALEVAGKAAERLRAEACTESARLLRGETIGADLESERLIVEALRSSGLSFRVVSEESGVIGAGDYTFVVDPLDGSVNYEHCIPWSSISVAVAPPGSSRLSDVVAGAVVPVFGGRPLSFARGSGCYEGDSRAPAPPVSLPKVLFVYVESPDEVGPIASLMGAVRGLKVRSLGSAALEISYAGLGRAYAFVDLRAKLRNVDVAAAVGLARECGAAVVDRGGAPVDGPIDRVAVVGDVIVTARERLGDLMRGLGLAQART